MDPRVHRTSDPPTSGPAGHPPTPGAGGDANDAVGPAAAGRRGARTSGRQRSASAQGGQLYGGPQPGTGADGELTGRPAYPLPGSSGPAHDDDAPVYVISIAAELAGMHPQTLRSYDRLGLVTPGRTAGRGRRYSARDVALLREVQRLSQEEGVNLEGIRQILRLGAQVIALQAEVRQLREELAKARVEADRRVAEAHASHRRDLVPVDRGAIVVWRPGPRR